MLWTVHKLCSVYFFRKMQHELDTYRQNVDKINLEAKKLGPQGQLDTGAVCQICHKTKFADGVGHMCHYCQLKSCARCGGRMTVKQNKVQLNTQYNSFTNMIEQNN